MAKTKDSQPQQTMEDYLLAQLNEEVILKDGTQLKAADGHVMTKQEAIATNLINLAMKGDMSRAYTDGKTERTTSSTCEHVPPSLRMKRQSTSTS